MPDTDDNVFAQAVRLISEQMGVAPSRITPRTRFVEDLGADSLDKVALIMELESRYMVEVSDEDAMRMRTIDDVVTYVEQRR